MKKAGFLPNFRCTLMFSVAIPRLPFLILNLNLSFFISLPSALAVFNGALLFTAKPRFSQHFEATFEFLAMRYG